MGKKEKGKKKGKGVEKTLAKTEKKVANKIKKELIAIGEDDIETIVAQIEKEEKQRLHVTETQVDPPSSRLNFSFVSHPNKDQLILYGGEYFNGQKTYVYNELFFYNIPNNIWTIVKAPGAPPPRCGHQMVTTSANNGQLWIFGGEFASPTQSQFYHYRDLWVYHLGEKKWEKISPTNGPSARSGHRMIILKKRLVVFGGFHDNLRDYKYFNDIHVFDIETYKWTKVEPVGTPPAPRSGCCMAALSDGRILIYGGYSKEKVKKDVDKGCVYTDAFILVPEKHNAEKFKWQQVKLGGSTFSPRCSMPMVMSPNNLSAYCFGGVFDIEEDEENISGQFFNNLLQLDLEKLNWRSVSLNERKEIKQRRRKNKDEDVGDDEEMEVKEVEEKLPTILDDGVFTVTIGPTTSVAAGKVPVISEIKDNFHPSPRMNCGLAIKHGMLYLYGGMFEDGDRQLTYSDLYSLDLKKLDKWKTLIEDSGAKMEWFGSDSEQEDEQTDGSSDSNDQDGDSEMETN
ncbi:kelch domain-containing protein 4 [Cylas formicarius]|uniref:kelch domain-containing protein 4 n=1 Tax=Cylas formicarius TaxID=197179 RepID=UPI002958CC10|nr:kelch domain-containing protein 4 [Cylas formicarius]